MQKSPNISKKKERQIKRRKNMHFIKRQRTKDRDNKYNNYESDAGDSDKDDIKVKINSNKSFFKSKNHDAYVDLDKSYDYITHESIKSYDEQGKTTKASNPSKTSETSTSYKITDNLISKNNRCIIS